MQPSSQASSLSPQSSLADIWSRVLEAVSRASPFTKSYLIEARPVSYADGIFIIGYDPEFAEHKNLVDNAKHRQVLQTKLREVLAQEVTVRFCLIEEEVTTVATPESTNAKSLPVRQAGKIPAAAGGQNPCPSDRQAKSKPDTQDFRDDPLIRQALEIFRGQIVAVKT